MEKRVTWGSENEQGFLTLFFWSVNVYGSEPGCYTSKRKILGYKRAKTRTGKEQSFFARSWLCSLEFLKSICFSLWVWDTKCELYSKKGPGKHRMEEMQPLLKAQTAPRVTKTPQTHRIWKSDQKSRLTVQYLMKYLKTVAAIYKQYNNE